MKNDTLSTRAWNETGLSYNGQTNQEKCYMQDTVSLNIDKENIVPCPSKIQSCLATLTQKKYQLKSLQFERQKWQQHAVQQNAKIQQEFIKQKYQISKEVQFLKQNQRIIEQIQTVKMQKLKHMQRALQLKKPMQSRFQQIIQMKRLISELKEQNVYLSEKNQQIKILNENLSYQVTEVDVMNENLNKDVYKMKEDIREKQVRITTAQTAIKMIDERMQSVLLEIKKENKEMKLLNALMKQTSDRVKIRREEKVQYEIDTHNLMVKNREIEDVNIKLRNDLEKVQNHLQAIMKNNQLLERSLAGFNDIDEKVSKIVNRAQIKNL